MTKDVAYQCANCGQGEMRLSTQAPPSLCSECGDDEFLIAGNSNTPPEQRPAIVKAKFAYDEIHFLRSILLVIERQDMGKSGEMARKARMTADQLYGKKKAG